MCICKRECGLKRSSRGQTRSSTGFETGLFEFERKFALESIKSEFAVALVTLLPTTLAPFAVLFDDVPTTTELMAALAVFRVPTRIALFDRNQQMLRIVSSRQSNSHHLAGLCNSTRLLWLNSQQPFFDLLLKCEMPNSLLFLVDPGL